MTSIQEIKLEPTPLWDEGGFFSTAEQAVVGSLVSELKTQVGRVFISPDFESSEIPGQLADSVTKIAPAAIRRKLWQEARRHDVKDMPLTARLGELAIDPDYEGELLPSRDFIDAMTAEILGIDPRSFSELDTYHARLEDSGYLGLVRSVDAAARGHESGNDSWADRAYNIVSQAIDPSVTGEYTLPGEQVDALYGICFMPHYGRSLTRRLITNNTMAAMIGNRLGDEVTDGETATFEVMRRVMMSEVLTGQHWTDLPVSEVTLKAIALKGAASLEDYGIIQQNVRSGAAGRVGDIWQAVYTELASRIERVMIDSPMSRWESQDIGHCFSGFWTHSLIDAFQRGGKQKRGYEVYPEKDGSNAVILEDDKQQMATWRGVVDRHLPQTVDRELCFSTSDGVVETADDPNVSLFLLDIQNGDDETAGIRVAEAIIGRRVQMRQANPDLTTKIVVWSASKALVAQAGERLKQVVKELTDGGRDISLYISGSGGTQGGRIMVEVQPKEWNLYDLTSADRELHGAENP